MAEIVDIYISYHNKKMILSGKSASGIGYEKSEWSRNLSSDLWLLEIDSLGRKIRDKTIGGNSVEEYFSRHGVQKVGDWGYLLAGSSLSTIGYDKTDTCRGDYDFWLILLDTTLQNIKWQGTIGGGATDYCMKTTILSDGSIIAAGYSLSGISGDKKNTRQRRRRLLGSQTEAGSCDGVDRPDHSIQSEPSRRFPQLDFLASKTRRLLCAGTKR